MKSKRILVVDDDNSMRQVIKDTLIDQFDVIEARHGHEAIRFADSKKPDLIIIDIELPGLTGIDVCKRLKATNHKKIIPVILISSHTRKEQTIIGLQAGADDYLTKPINPIEALSRVDARLNQFLFTTTREQTIDRDI